MKIKFSFPPLLCMNYCSLTYLASIIFCPAYPLVTICEVSRPWLALSSLIRLVSLRGEKQKRCNFRWLNLLVTVILTNLWWVKILHISFDFGLLSGFHFYYSIMSPFSVCSSVLSKKCCNLLCSLSY